jgi:transaldolase
MAIETSPLLQTVSAGTDFWNDSCSLDELSYAIAHGASGATTNPTIVLQVLRLELGRWQDRIVELCAANPTASEDELTWRLIEEMAVRAAALLEPVFARESGRKGRLSIQTDPTLYRNAEAIVAQATRFHGLAPNMQVKIPVTRAGLAAIEEATARGVNVNATVCFTVAQALAVGEAVERGLRRRSERIGHGVTAPGSAGREERAMTPVCTIMVGRLDDWLKVVADRDALLVTPGALDWAGIACLKRAQALYRERGYRTRLLAAAYRHRLHWSELVGGEIILTIPAEWQRRFNASPLEVRPRFDAPVPEAILSELSLIPDFRRALEPDGLRPEEFDSFGATRRTLRTFIASYRELQGLIRDFMLPDPDRRGGARR